MNNSIKYKVIIIALCWVVVIQAALLIRFWPRKKIEPTIAIKGKIAIVIDDWGYNLNNLHFLDEIKYPLNIAVLPNQNYSKKVAGKLRTKSHELILHLPLEPKDQGYKRLEPDTITTDMEPLQIREILLKAIGNFSSIKGISNHMGSKATVDYPTMQIIFKELQKRRLYFLDSVVNPDTICENLASKMKISFIKRDIFLDIKKSRAYIKAQLEKLKQKALLQDYAVGIGHDHRVTLETLKEVMPELEKQGFKFVFVSELVK